MPLRPPGYNPQQPRRRPRYAVPMQVAEVLRDGEAYRAFKYGVNFEVHTKAGGTPLEVGDFILSRFVQGAQQLFLPQAPLVESLYYGIPKQTISSNHEAELWEYDGVSHTLVYTTSVTAGSPNISAWITCAFYVPRNGFVYFLVYKEDFSSNDIETNYMYKLNPTTGIVTSISVTIPSDTDGTDTKSPPDRKSVV